MPARNHARQGGHEPTKSRMTRADLTATDRASSTMTALAHDENDSLTRVVCDLAQQPAMNPALALGSRLAHPAEHQSNDRQMAQSRVCESRPATDTHTHTHFTHHRC
jgi:hypothetical protein